MKTISIIALAGIAAASTAGTNINLNFSADSSAVAPGETIVWTVSASFSGVSSSGYFGGFVGDFLANDNSLGVTGAWVSNMSGNATTPEDGIDASLRNLNVFNSALLGTDDQSNPYILGTFETMAAAEGFLSYTGDGTVSLFNDDGIFALPDEFSGTAISTSDSVSIIPAPGAMALLGLGGMVAVRRRR